MLWVAAGRDTDLFPSRTRLSRERSAAATADGCHASSRKAGGGHVYRPPRCLRHHQPPLPGRVLTAAGAHSISAALWRPSTQRQQGRASALTERPDPVFRAVSRQSRRHPGRHLQRAVFYARVGSYFQPARHRWPGHWQPLPVWRDGEEARIRGRRRAARLDGSWGICSCLCAGERIENIRLDGDVGAQVEGHALGHTGATSRVDGSGGWGPWPPKQLPRMREVFPDYTRIGGAPSLLPS